MKGNIYENFVGFDHEDSLLIQTILARQPSTVCGWYCRTGQIAIEVAQQAGFSSIEAWSSYDGAVITEDTDRYYFVVTK